MGASTVEIDVMWAVVRYRKHGERSGVIRRRIELWLIKRDGTRLKRLERCNVGARLWSRVKTKRADTEAAS
jgi:hypothetical protein